MLKKFTPTWRVKSIYQIDPDQLKAVGIKAVLTDLDNTLIAWNNPVATKETLQWIQRMKEADMPVVIVSNNSGGRVKKVADLLDVQFIPKARKPKISGLLRAVKQLQLDKTEVVMVGDQLITDVWAGNRAGIRTIHVLPVVDNDEWKTKLNRSIERKVLMKWLKYQSPDEWEDSINGVDYK
ncbi:YqeG family HAD IIIA-type phosphatase [Atopobacter phocae]|uniref:YqeG family HAD IIIA-type phosphatase n=1 Tax=Atopobacter phocae TaxID=136492 RepID=UPI0004720139|nr:YqeG family HAD IIIA-type phosphatase [Atopobacter phocae]